MVAESAYARRRLKAAIVGCGPSGFYAAEVLVSQIEDIQVDMFDKLPAPFGLVRYGVAPDHPKLKKPIAIYEGIAEMEEVRFFGNVEVGTDITVAELKTCYDFVLLTYGAQSDAKLNIPGEDLSGCHSATEFVGWYNGHPEFQSKRFDLSGETAVIVGNGNVAADVARILLKPVCDLEETDITSKSVAVLKSSKIKHVHIVGRRTVAQAKFGNQEFRELTQLPGVRLELSDGALDLNENSLEEVKMKSQGAIARNLSIITRAMENQSSNETPNKTLYFHFLRSPVEIAGDERIERILLEKNTLVGEALSQKVVGTKKFEELACDILFSSIGYKGSPIDGLPFDEERGVVPNESGRVSGEAGLYVAGWIKRGPSGTIGSNRACALETVECVVRDIQDGKIGPRSAKQSIKNILIAKNIRVVDFSEWKKIDAKEIEVGTLKNKTREKFLSTREMLEVLRI